MAPPTYGDLGKSARDVFGKGYHFSLLKLNVKTKTPSGVEFETGGSSNTESGKVAGSLETKYKCSDYGLTLTEKWSTDNQLATTVELADKPLAGAKLVFDSTFCPQSGAKSGKVKTSYKQVYIDFHEKKFDFGDLTKFFLRIWLPLTLTLI